MARASVEHDARRVEFALGGGLRLRVHPSGKAVFTYRYKAPGYNALRTITLAPVGKRVTAQDLQTAEELHRAAKRDRDAALDPLTSRNQRRVDAAAEAASLKAERDHKAFTVRRLAKEYVDHASARKRSWREDQRIFDAYVLPLIGDMPVADVDLKAVRKVLGKLEGKVAMRKNTQAACRACWSWHDPAGANPWKAERVPVPQPRERTLTVKELRELLARLATESDPGRDAVELILLTGARRTEVMEARRAEFHDDEWRIPAERMKAGRDHTVLLSTQAQRLVKSVLEAHNSEWLLPSPVRENAPVSRERAYKWLRGNGATYTLHDLRRTLSSFLGEQLVHDAVIDRVLAHRKQGVLKHYNHARLTEPARGAWQQWAEFLDSLTRRVG